jgi:hypothetical protein
MKIAIYILAELWAIICLMCVAFTLAYFAAHLAGVSTNL